MKAVIGFIALISLAGCSSTKQVELAQKELWISDAQSDLLGRYATVQTTDGHARSGDIITLNADSLCLLEENTRSVYGYNIDRVAMIQRPTNAWPVIGGLFGGVLVGALIGGAIGTDNALHADNAESGSETFLTSPLIGGAIGGTAGAIIVGAATSTTSYQILYTSPRKVTARPAGASIDSTMKGK